MPAIRFLFLEGTLLAWAGVGPWLLFALKLTDAYQPFYGVLGYRTFLHPLAELEGFLVCFSVGLLFTLLREAPRPWQVAAAVIAPLATVVLTAIGQWQAGQAATLVLLLIALEFTLRRVPRSPDALWIPFGIVLGCAGAALAVKPDLAEVGRDLVMQGMFSALAIGAARLMRRDPPNRLLHAACGVAFAASFWIGSRFGAHLGFALRALTAIALARPLVPEWEFGPGNLRRGFAHLALWLLAFGNAWAALALNVRRAGLHVVFLGCFAALLMAAFTQANASRRLVALTTALLALSMMARAMVELDPGSYHLWMGISSASFLLATLACAVLSLRASPTPAPPASAGG